MLKCAASQFYLHLEATRSWVVLDQEKQGLSQISLTTQLSTFTFIIPRIVSYAKTADPEEHDTYFTKDPWIQLF